MNTKTLIIVVLLLACVAGGIFLVQHIQRAPELTPTPTPVTTISTTTPATSSASFTFAQVATHNSVESCYTVIRNNVYDLTSWVGEHPGGKKAILGICGKDGTAAFKGQHGGQYRPEQTLARFKIGGLIAQ